MRDQANQLSTGTLLLMGSWFATAAAGFLFLGAYHARPGLAGHVAGSWPGAGGVVSRGPGMNLVMFVHPRCPCTPASLSELAELVADSRGKFTPHVVLTKPTEAREGWEATSVERAAAAIPGVRLWQDRGGFEARRFGVVTSGHVLLFDAAGGLAFGGGITPARGHEGDNYGRTAVAALVAGRPAAGRDHPVFGCPLVNPGPEAEE